MPKIDFKKTLPSYKAKKGKFEIIVIPKLQYLMIDGTGDPNTSTEFKDAIETLFPVAYKLKFFSKIELNRDYTVGPLEGLWWADDMSKFTSDRDKSKWNWTAMIITPDWITKKMFVDVLEKLKEKHLKSVSKIRLETLDERLAVQTLHIGSFDNEGEILEEMHSKFIPANNLKMTGKHHEIYLSDFRKVRADKLRTILRQPVAKI